MPPGPHSHEYVLGKPPKKKERKNMEFSIPVLTQASQAEVCVKKNQKCIADS